MTHKTEIFKNLISPEILDTLSSLISSAAEDAEEEQIVRAYHGNYYPVGEDATRLISNLLPLLPNEVCSVSLLKHTRVTGPHTDTNIPDHDTVSDPNTFARTFIIPLKTQDTSTIVFEQCMEHGSVGKNMIPYVMNLPVTNQITEDQIEKYFHSSRDEYWLDKLSIEIVFPWIAGDVLAFDRNRIHTGDNHLNKVEKEGIVIWTTIN